MLLSLCYLLLHRVLPLAVWRWRSPDLKELEIAVLRHELAILRRQTKRPAVTAIDRLFLAAASRVLPRSHWRSFIIAPDTLLRWHRRLVTKRWTYAHPVGRPRKSREIRDVGRITDCQPSRAWPNQLWTPRILGAGLPDPSGDRKRLRHEEPLRPLRDTPRVRNELATKGRRDSGDLFTLVLPAKLHR